MTEMLNTCWFFLPGAFYIELGRWLLLRMFSCFADSLCILYMGGKKFKGLLFKHCFT